MLRTEQKVWVHCLGHKGIIKDFKDGKVVVAYYKENHVRVNMFLSENIEDYIGYQQRISQQKKDIEKENLILVGYVYDQVVWINGVGKGILKGFDDTISQFIVSIFIEGQRKIKMYNKHSIKPYYSKEDRDARASMQKI